MYPKLFELGPATVYTYGVLLAAAYLFGLKLAMVRAQARGLDANRVLDLGIYIIISALIGAKLLLLVTDFRAFTADPRELLTLARSGGVFYGGLILAVTVALVYIRRVGPPLGVPLHPTQLYEAGAELLILGVLLLTERKGRPFPGRTFWLYMLLYAFSRFIIEFFRGDERGTVGMFSTSQFISVVLAPLAIAMLVWLSRATTPEPKRAKK